MSWREVAASAFDNSALGQRHAHPHHHHPTIHPRPFCPPRARLAPLPARSSLSASFHRARDTRAAAATAASPPYRAASASGRYSSTTSLLARAAHQLHLRARPSGASSYHGTFTHLLIRGRGAPCGHPQRSAFTCTHNTVPRAPPPHHRISIPPICRPARQQYRNVRSGPSRRSSSGCSPLRRSRP